MQLLAIGVIIVFAFFLNDSSIIDRMKYDAKIRELNSQIDYYRKKTVEDQQQLEQLHSSKDDIEKFARERYLMRKADEDIFIVE